MERPRCGGHQRACSREEQHGLGARAVAWSKGSEEAASQPVCQSNHYPNNALAALQQVLALHGASAPLREASRVARESDSAAGRAKGVCRPTESERPGRRWSRSGQRGSSAGREVSAALRRVPTAQSAAGLRLGDAAVGTRRGMLLRWRLSTRPQGGAKRRRAPRATAPQRSDRARRRPVIRPLKNC